MKLITRLHDLVLEGLKPDITFLLDLSPEIGLSRAWQQIDKGSRTGDETRFEKEALSFHQKIRIGYLELARLKPQRFYLIDASQEINKVQMDIEKRLALI